MRTCVSKKTVSHVSSVTLDNEQQEVTIKESSTSGQGEISKKRTTNSLFSLPLFRFTSIVTNGFAKESG